MSKKNRKKRERPKGTLKDMLMCPYCNAMSYPYIIADPKTPEEQNAVICGSCHKDAYPFMRNFLDIEREIDDEMEGKKEIDESVDPEELFKLREEAKKKIGKEEELTKV